MGLLTCPGARRGNPPRSKGDEEVEFSRQDERGESDEEDPVAARRANAVLCQARALLLGMINTGYRPSEGAARAADTIRLDSDVPHISIEPEGRQLKSHYAIRVISLTGVSLEAFKQYPEGFPRSRNRATLSAVVNKFLRANGLLATLRHPRTPTARVDLRFRVGPRPCLNAPVREMNAASHQARLLRIDPETWARFAVSKNPDDLSMELYDFA